MKTSSAKESSLYGLSLERPHQLSYKLMVSSRREKKKPARNYNLLSFRRSDNCQLRPSSCGRLCRDKKPIMANPLAWHWQHSQEVDALLLKLIAAKIKQRVESGLLLADGLLKILRLYLCIFQPSLASKPVTEKQNRLQLVVGWIKSLNLERVRMGLILFILVHSDTANVVDF